MSDCWVICTLWENPDTKPAFTSTLVVLGTVQLNLRWHLYLQAEDIMLVVFGMPSLHPVNHIFSTIVSFNSCQSPKMCILSVIIDISSHKGF